MNFINESSIQALIDHETEPSPQELDQILSRALELKRLPLLDVAKLLKVTKPESLKKIYATANQVKNLIYGNRIVFFAPLYISNYCLNNCTYCAFRVDNNLARKALSYPEIENETASLLKDGHKRILLVSGEAYPEPEGLDYILKAIDTVYAARFGRHNIRRVNVNIAPLDEPDFKKLIDHQIGTYQLFQETYHSKTYAEVHPSGQKADYEYRLTGMDRAFKAGIDDVGIGVLFGLYDYQFEVLALLSHIEHLETTFGLGPHTISIPRLEPAAGTNLPEKSPYKVSDADFKKLVAILRLAVPYTGIILSTRENAEQRRELLSLGVSQISAGSRTNPGGYQDNDNSLEQFSLGDHRSLDDVMYDLLSMGFTPSFCTACYRSGRTGLDFMEFAKPGQIKKKCEPNAIITLKEYLVDFASDKVRNLGNELIKSSVQAAPENMRNFILKSLADIDQGKRDIFT